MVEDDIYIDGVKYIKEDKREKREQWASDVYHKIQMDTFYILARNEGYKRERLMNYIRSVLKKEYGIQRYSDVPKEDRENVKKLMYEIGCKYMRDHKEKWKLEDAKRAKEADEYFKKWLNERDKRRAR